METADRGRQTAKWTMDGRPWMVGRAGFPACQKTASERGARKNFVPL